MQPPRVEVLAQPLQFVDRAFDELRQHVPGVAAGAAHLLDALAVRGGAGDEAFAIDALQVGEAGVPERVGEPDDRRRRHAGIARELGHGRQRHRIRIAQREPRDALQAVGQLRVRLGDRPRKIVVTGAAGHGIAPAPRCGGACQGGMFILSWNELEHRIDPSSTPTPALAPATASMTSAAESAIPPSLRAPARPAATLPVPLLVLAVLLATTPLWLARIGLYQYLALEIAIFMIYAMGYNLLLGNSGLPSFGHGAFFGVGAYAFGLLQLKVWPNLWFDLVGAVLAAALLGGAVAAFISHRRGIYYALLTIAFGQVFWFVAIKWHSVTGGEDGLLNLKRLPAQFGFTSVDMRSNEALFFLTLALLLRRSCSSAGASCIRRSAACSSASSRTRCARASSVTASGSTSGSCSSLSAGIAGLAGALFAMAQHSAYPNVMSLHQSGFVVMMVLIGGGLTSFWGPLIGAAFFILARDLLGAYTETWLFWYGLLFMAIVLFKPEGLAGIGARSSRPLAAAGAR